MGVDLHTSSVSSSSSSLLPYRFLPEKQGKGNEQPLTLSSRDHHYFHSSLQIPKQVPIPLPNMAHPIDSWILDSQQMWDLMGSSSSLESPTASSGGISHDSSSFETTTYDVLSIPDNTIKLYHHPTHHAGLIQEQIRAIQLGFGEEKKKMMQKEKKVGAIGVEIGNGVRTRLTGAAPEVSTFGSVSGSRGGGSSGTGVFLPRPATTHLSRTTPGKGCSNILIPARVVQALQHHFEQMAVTSGPKAAAGFPPLHDVLVSNRDGMYSLQKRQSRKSQPNMQQGDMILPQEWTY
ncbi:uncharacterized protein LOC130967752 isoform X2 [Arachis stenosperma]|uniref:uncharacterized protein LOC130967752 isoform X2 n=1 Tax=Arachis stenosperma TaxID=217475 RepID=UPI0025ACF98F|nr:uncharacterized protein LOC130967752 isoform X2 [Arachis stenosperma]